MRLSYVMLVAAVIGCGGGGGDGYTTGPTGGTNSGGTGGTGGSGGGAGTATATASVSAPQTDDGYGSAVFAFSPAAVSITRGGTVTWSNGSSTTLHNVTFTTGGAPTNVSNFTASTGTVSRTFPNAGTYSYQCTNHAGMNGSVRVE